MTTYPLSNYSSDLVTAATQGIQSPDALTLTHGLNMGVGGDRHGSVLLACQGKANLLKLPNTYILGSKYIECFRENRRNIRKS